MTLTPKQWPWTDPPAVPRLDDFPDAAPQVWLARLPDNADVQSYLASLLSADERARRERLRLPGDQLRFLVARGLLRLLLGSHLHMPPGRVELSRDAHGKPFVVLHTGAPALQFNVSHSGNLVLLAFHPERPVGVDVEEVRPDTDWALVARQTFRPNEYRAWADLPPNERPAAFFRAWTRHEAGLKALGCGFADRQHPLPDTGLQFFEVTSPAGYQGSVCLRSTPG